MKFNYSPHIAIEVLDHKKAIEFYQSVLGMKKISDSTECGDESTHLKCDEMSFFIDPQTSSNTPPCTQRVFFELSVSDSEEAKKILKNNDCQITSSNMKNAFMAKDPFGIYWHIYQKN